MQYKISLLLVTLIVLFSLQDFAQTTPKSEHPLLDKYYPRPKADTPKTVATPIKSVPETKPAPAVVTVPAVTAPAVVTSPAAVVTAPVVNKPVTDTTRDPIQKKVQTQPVPGHPYRDTRLGSSTSAYDTYEKNNNGAGSVTTSPK